MIHERRDSTDSNFDWKECLRKHGVTKSRPLQQFSIRDNYGGGAVGSTARNSSLGQLGFRDTSKQAANEVCRNSVKTKGRNELSNSNDTISEGIFNANDKERSSLREAGFFKVSKRSGTRNSFRESYMKMTESLMLKQKPNFRNSESVLIDHNQSSKGDLNRGRQAKEKSHLEDDASNKENFMGAANREIQGIKKCLEAMKNTSSALNLKTKPTRKSSQNPVLRLKKQDDRTTSQAPRITVSRTEPDCSNTESSVYITEQSVVQKDTFLAYAAVSDTGNTRKYNEDRVCAVEKITRMQDQSSGGSFFAVFDGHGGYQCCNTY